MSARVGLLITAGTLAVTLGVTAQANAATIYACVAKHGGATRIVKKTTRCKPSESKLVWNSEGSAGKAGAPGAAGKEGATGKNGTNGKDGTNGAVAGYSAVQSTPLVFTGTEVLILSKTLPAGSYIVAAKSQPVVTEGTADGFVSLNCALYWENSTSEEKLDEAEWAGGLGEYAAGKWGSDATLSLDAAVNFSTGTEVQVWCRSSLASTGAAAFATNTVITAVQTNGNH